MSSAQPQPGWYTDPRSADDLRYWDGSAWTTHTRPRAVDSTISLSPLAKAKVLLDSSDHPVDWSRHRRGHVAVAAAIPLLIIAGIATAIFGLPDIDRPSEQSAPDSLPFTEGAADDPDADREDSAEPTTTTTTTTIGLSSQSTEQLEPDELGAGVHEVGVDIAPGLYRVSIAWARLDEEMDVIDNDLTLRGVSIMRVFDTDAFVELTGDAVPIDELPALDPREAGYTQGTYLVGADVEPGWYRVTAEPGGTAFAARLDDGLVVIGDQQDEQFVDVEVIESDFAFRFTGVLELLDVDPAPES